MVNIVYYFLADLPQNIMAVGFLCCIYLSVPWFIDYLSS